MFDFFKPVMDFFQFIVDMIMMLIDMVIMAVGLFSSLFGFIPPVISGIAVTLVVVCVIYKILGRENQS